MQKMAWRKLNLREMMILGTGTMNLATMTLILMTPVMTERRHPVIVRMRKPWMRRLVQVGPTPGFETNTRNSRGSRSETQYRSARPRRQALD